MITINNNSDCHRNSNNDSKNYQASFKDYFPKLRKIIKKMDVRLQLLY